MHVHHTPGLQEETKAEGGGIEPANPVETGQRLSKPRPEPIRIPSKIQ